MANENLNITESGIKALSRHEGVKLSYYNDSADNCTYGIGTLVHTGVCSEEEMKTPVDLDTATKDLKKRMDDAAKYARSKVSKQNLTQEQFNSLVSFIYNVGKKGASDVLRLVNEGKLKEAGEAMQKYVYVTKKNKVGAKTKVRLKGLVNRRADESAPFLAQVTPKK
jgi:lysozyme